MSIVRPFSCSFVNQDSEIAARFASAFCNFFVSNKVMSFREKRFVNSLVINNRNAFWQCVRDLVHMPVLPHHPDSTQPAYDTADPPRNRGATSVISNLSNEI